MAGRTRSGKADRAGNSAMRLTARFPADAATAAAWPLGYRSGLAAACVRTAASRRNPVLRPQPGFPLLSRLPEGLPGQDRGGARAAAMRREAFTACLESTGPKGVSGMTLNCHRGVTRKTTWSILHHPLVSSGMKWAMVGPQGGRDAYWRRARHSGEVKGAGRSAGRGSVGTDIVAGGKEQSGGRVHDPGSIDTTGNTVGGVVRDCNAHWRHGPLRVHAGMDFMLSASHPDRDVYGLADRRTVRGFNAAGPGGCRHRRHGRETTRVSAVHRIWRAEVRGVARWLNGLQVHPGGYG